MKYTSRPSIRRAAITAICVLFVAAALLSSCSPGEDETLRRIAPGLSAEFAKRLVRDDNTFAAYANEVGVETLLDSYILLRESIPLDSPDAYRASANLVLPAMQKIALALNAEYSLPSVLREYGVLATAERGIPYRKLHVAQQAIFHDPALSAEAKLASLLDLLPQTDAPDMALLRPSIKYPISTLYAGMDDTENHLKFLREALSDARETQSYAWVCQLLGVLGTHDTDAGDAELMKVCWDEALAIAKRHRLAQHAARISSFYAWHYASQGRLSLAHALFDESQELCRKYKGGYYEIRYVLTAMEFQADLGCWEIVDRLYQRLSVLERQYIEPAANLPNEDFKHIHRAFKTGADSFKARLLMEKGDVDSANQLNEDLRTPVRQIRGRLGYPQFLFHWAEGLAANGRPADAMPLIREGLTDARENYLPWLATEFALLGARAQLSERHYTEALVFLDEFEELYAALGEEKKNRLRREWSLKEAVRARIYLASGDSAAANAALESGLERLERSLSTLDRGAQGYLWLSGCEEFRYLLADLTRHDAVLSYGSELYWRSLYRHLGSYDARAVSQLWTSVVKNTGGRSSIYDHVRSLAEKASTRIAEADGIHLVYSVGGDAIRRWTVDRNGIRVKKLDVDPNGLRERVSSIWQELSTDPGDTDAPVPPALVIGLHVLARDLLPEELLVPRATDADERPTASAGLATASLLISGDGYLAKIPFEALNVGSRERYEPLIERYDIAYLRHVGKPLVDVDRGPGVILAMTTMPSRLRDRYPLAGKLTEAVAEGEAVAELNPRALFLHGPAATKSILMSAWKDANFIYLAAHVLRDPQVPYLALIPMNAPDNRPGPDAAYLDISDIRKQTLTTCKVVVLSGCSSGAPYLTSYTAAPSLGDVFLDAGAGAVVQTFWAVADDYARELMTSYVKTWDSEGMPGVKGLNEVRRAALHGPHGIRHPFGWASYSIKLERF